MTQTTVTWATKAAQRGFTVAQNVVLFDDRLPAPARLLYVQLAHYAWRNPDAFPTQEEIAANLGVGDRQLRRYAAVLEERWLLERHERGLGRSVEYRLHEPAQDYLERAPKPGRQAKRVRLEVVVDCASGSDIDDRARTDIDDRLARSPASETFLGSPEAAVEATQDLGPGLECEEIQGGEDPAAEEPVTDREITEAVLALPGADIGSPKVVIPIAHGLPRSVFFDREGVVRQRRGSVGLLVDLLRIARAERTAALSAQLAAELGQHAPAYVPAPWLVDFLKRDDPDRYVRIMAAMPSYPAELLHQALHGRDDLERLTTLFAAVRAGDEHGDRVGTPEQERMRWTETHASDPDCDAVIDAWHDVDPLERQTLHEHAESVRTAKQKAA